jgi:hypothetical protein
VHTGSKDYEKKGIIAIASTNHHDYFETVITKIGVKFFIVGYC